MRLYAQRHRPLAGCRRTRKSVGGIRRLTTCHPLGSAGITRLPRYYGMIRLLSRHRPVVVAFSQPTATADLKRSPGVRLSNVPSLPPSILPGHGQIQGVVSPGELAQTGKPARGFTERSVLRFVSGLHPTRPHGEDFACPFGQDPSRAVAFDSWLPLTGPTEDFHLQSLNHAQRTRSHSDFGSPGRVKKRMFQRACRQTLTNWVWGIESGFGVALHCT